MNLEVFIKTVSEEESVAYNAKGSVKQHHTRECQLNHTERSSGPFKIISGRPPALIPYM